MRCIYKISLLLFAVACIMATTSCNVTKNVPANDKLYLGADVKYIDTTSDKKQKEVNAAIRDDLKKLIKPVPNTNILGVRYRLVLYNMFHEPKKPKGLVYDIKHNWGRPPVLLSQARPELTSKKLEDQLFSEGFLKPAVHGEIKTKDSARTATIDYIVNAGIRYTVRNIIWPKDTSALIHHINEDSSRSLIKRGGYFDLNTFKLERERIDRHLKDSGYYYFSPDNLLFRIDSLHNGQADLYVTLKEGIAPQGLRPWHYGTITVFSDYSLEKDSLLNTVTPKEFEGLYIVDPEKKYTSKLLRRVIVIHENEMYRYRKHSLTIERLMNLNTFKFVKMDFEPEAATGKMNTRIYLTPAKRRAISLELSGNTKSNNFVGTEISASEKNVNWFHGAEIIEIKFNAGIDAQVGGGEQLSKNAYTFKEEINLYVPKMVVPFAHITFPKSSYLPRSLINVSVEQIRRQGLYTLQSANFGIGYYWKSSRTVENTLRFLNLTAIKSKKLSPDFDTILAKDPALRASFENQLMINTYYEFKFNNTYKFAQPFTYAIDFKLITSGNVASLFSHPQVDTPNAKKLFGLPISQFLRGELDMRGYYKISQNLVWANRIIGGIGYPYGNSIAIPYSQQFFIGGSSSLRGFRARTLGPGSYHTNKSVYEANQSGEIKAELNSELRISLNKYFKLATFMDAGNIWYRKDVPGQPGSGLDKGDFFKEMAVDGGLGLRFDASIMVVRFDIALPLRKPWYPEKNRWVFNQIDLGNKAWRKENLVLNIGIGYPF